MALIEAIHRRHEQLRRTTDPTFFEPACVLCVEERQRREARQPSWLGHLVAKEMTPGRAA